MKQKLKVAVLDDYQKVSQHFADWSLLSDSAEVTAFNDHLNNLDDLIKRLQPFSVVCVMRERTPLGRELLSTLPNLRLIVSTGSRNASIDVKAAEELGIIIKNTGYIGTGAPELTWALLMAIARKIPLENNNFKSGGWQTTIGTDLKGKTIGIVGLGNIGAKIASYAKTFDMKAIAWSENLTAEKATAAGAQLVSKETLFRESDFITIHLVLSARSKGIIKAQDLNQMKPSAYIINTSRGPLIDEEALIEILQQKRIAGAAIDVFNQEPLAENHPFRHLENILATPHIGYVTTDTYSLFYRDTVTLIKDWMSKQKDNV